MGLHANPRAAAPGGRRQPGGALAAPLSAHLLVSLLHRLARGRDGALRRLQRLALLHRVAPRLLHLGPHLQQAAGSRPAAFSPRLQAGGSWSRLPAANQQPAPPPRNKQRKCKASAHVEALQLPNLGFQLAPALQVLRSKCGARVWVRRARRSRRHRLRRGGSGSGGGCRRRRGRGRGGRRHRRRGGGCHAQGSQRGADLAGLFGGRGSSAQGVSERGAGSQLEGLEQQCPVLRTCRLVRPSSPLRSSSLSATRSAGDTQKGTNNNQGFAAAFVKNQTGRRHSNESGSRGEAKALPLGEGEGTACGSGSGRRHHSATVPPAPSPAMAFSLNASRTPCGSSRLASHSCAKGRRWAAAPAVVGGWQVRRWRSQMQHGGSSGIPNPLLVRQQRPSRLPARRRRSTLLRGLWARPWMLFGVGAVRRSAAEVGRQRGCGPREP